MCPFPNLLRRRRLNGPRPGYHAQCKCRNISQKIDSKCRKIKNEYVLLRTLYRKQWSWVLHFTWTPVARRSSLEPIEHTLTGAIDPWEKRNDVLLLNARHLRLGSRPIRIRGFRGLFQIARDENKPHKRSGEERQRSLSVTVLLETEILFILSC